MWDSEVDVVVCGEVVVVESPLLPTFEVVGEELDDVVWECGMGEFVYENVDVYSVECFGEVKSYHDGSLWWFWLVEACSYGVGGLL